MRDILNAVHAPAEPDPVKRAQNAMARQALPKRFYADVAVEDRGAEGFAIALDGRIARTPGRRLLALPSRTAAEVVAAEWRAQDKVIDPATMPATRMANTAIDSLDGRIAEVQADVASYAGSDLVCYRAAEPEGLVARQNALWNPVIDWAAQAWGVRFVLAEGVIHQPQPAEALAAAARAAECYSEPAQLAALHVMTTLAGSCLISLMTAEGALPADAAWAAATVDDEWSAHLWGFDAEAAARLARRREEFLAAHALCRAFA